VNRGNQLPRALGIMTRLAFARAKAAGIAIAPILESCGMTRKQIDDPRERLRVRDQVEFLNLVADALKDDLLGFHLAQQSEPRAVGLYYYVLATSENIGEVFRRAARYTSLVNEGVVQNLVDGRVLGIRTAYTGVSRVRDRHQVEFWTASMMRLMRDFTGVRVKPQRVCFAHPAKESGRELNSYFGCTVEYGAPSDEVIFAGSVAELPVVNADPYLNRVLLSICEEAYESRSTNRASIRTRVENEIASLLPHGKARVGYIASQLGLSQRTLARHLADEDTSFTEMLTNIRRDLASRYLKDETLSISQIAWLLGFQDLGSFSHAYKRWFGTAPRESRG
jgi:AraC-like DNA-binding protein